MNKEEFLDFLNSSREEIELEKEREAKFKKKLSDSLYSFVINSFPTLNTNEEGVSTQLLESSIKCASSILENLFQVVRYQEKGIHFGNDFFLPRIVSKEESKKILSETLLGFKSKGVKLSEEEIEYFKKVHWKNYEERLFHQIYRKGVHDKTKEVLVDFYEEEILELDGEYLRLLDGYVYMTLDQSFIDEVYELVEHR